MERDKVLAWVNGIRAVKGLDPIDTLPPNEQPLGWRSRTCPLALATKGRVGNSTYEDASVVAPLPSYVRKAVSEFDAELALPPLTSTSSYESSYYDDLYDDTYH